MKKLLLYLSFLFLANIAFAQAKIGSDGDVISTGLYPVVKSGAVKGGLHFFQTLVQRNTLPANFRDTGMLAYVVDSAKFFYLNNGILNANWAVWQGGATGIDSTSLSTDGDTTFLNLYKGGVLLYSYYWQGDGGSVSSTDNWDSTLLRQTTPISNDHDIDFGGHNLEFDSLGSLSMNVYNPSTFVTSSIRYDSHNDYIGLQSQLSTGDMPFSQIITSYGLVDIESTNNSFPSQESNTIQITPNLISFSSSLTDSTKIKILNLDSSNADPNNIAWFDTNHILHRGAAQIMQSGTPTSSSDSRGNTGDQLYDANYIYIKTSAGWKRTALTTF